MKRFATMLVLTLCVIAAGSCSSSGSGSSAAKFNNADVTFTQQMIPHHQQAVEMADMAPKQAASPQVTGLAKRIRAAQAPEIAQMRSWLKTWHKPEPGQSRDSGMGHGDMGSMGQGMMSDADMKLLQRRSGPAFDTLFLTMMVKHHQGAVTMANQELRSGSSTDAKTLARSIVKAQEAEISEMQNLLTHNDASG